MTTDFKALIKSLSKKQRDVLDQIACENDKSHSQLTLVSLVKKGLILQDEERHDILIVHRYSVPWAVHIAWCEVCAEENPEELEAIA